MFSRTHAQQILARAAEIEGTDDGGPLTADELRAIAGEAGFGSRAVEQAMAEVQAPDPVDVERQPVLRSGLVVTHLSTLRTLPVAIDSEQLMRAVRLFQPYREGPAHVELEEDRVTWRDRRGLRFTVTASGGCTQIRVFVSRVMVRRGRWMGWVNAAANRLESLVLLVAAEGRPRPVERLAGPVEAPD